MKKEFEEFKKIKEMASNSQLTETAAEMVRRQVESISRENEYSKYSDSFATALKLNSGYEAVAALEKNLSISSQFKNEIEKQLGIGSAFKHHFDELAKAKEMLQSDHAYASVNRPSDTVFKESSSTSESVEDKLVPHLTNFPKNPIYETNAKLDKLQSSIEGVRPMAIQAAQLIDSLNEVAIKMQIDSIKNAANTSRQTKIAIWLSALSLIFSSLFSIKTSIDSNEIGEKSEAQLKAFQNEIRAITAVQTEGNAALLKSINDAASKVMKADRK